MIISFLRKFDEYDHFHEKLVLVINRPGVAGAVLQTPLSLIDSDSQ